MASRGRVSWFSGLTQQEALDELERIDRRPPRDDVRAYARAHGIPLHNALDADEMRRMVAEVLRTRLQDDRETKSAAGTPRDPRGAQRVKSNRPVGASSQDASDARLSMPPPPARRRRRSRGRRAATNPASISSKAPPRVEEQSARRHSRARRRSRGKRGGRRVAGSRASSSPTPSRDRLPVADDAEDDDDEDDDGNSDDAAAPSDKSAEDDGSGVETVGKAEGDAVEGEPGAPAPASKRVRNTQPPAAPPALLRLANVMWPGVARYTDVRSASVLTGTQAGAARALQEAQTVLTRSCRITTRCGERCASLLGDAETYAALDLTCKLACLRTLEPKLRRGLELLLTKYSFNDAMLLLYAVAKDSEVVVDATEKIVFVPERVVRARLEPDFSALQYVGATRFSSTWLTDMAAFRVDFEAVGEEVKAAFVTAGGRATEDSHTITAAMIAQTKFRKALAAAIVNPTVRRIVRDVCEAAPTRCSGGLIESKDGLRGYVSVDLQLIDRSDFLALAPLMQPWLPRNFFSFLLQLGSKPFSLSAQGRSIEGDCYTLRNVPMPQCAGYEELAEVARRNRDPLVYDADNNSLLEPAS